MRSCFADSEVLILFLKWLRKSFVLILPLPCSNSPLTSDSVTLLDWEPRGTGDLACDRSISSVLCSSALERWFAVSFSASSSRALFLAPVSRELFCNARYWTLLETVTGAFSSSLTSLFSAFKVGSVFLFALSFASSLSLCSSSNYRDIQDDKLEEILMEGGGHFVFFIFGVFIAFV